MIGIVIAIVVLIVLSWWNVLWCREVITNPYSITMTDGF